MITSMHIQNFKCFKDFTIDLGPFNVLIGPNDSGKTSLLESILIASAVGPGVAAAPSHILTALGVPAGPGIRFQGASLEDSVRIRVRLGPEGSGKEGDLAVSQQQDILGAMRWASEDIAPGSPRPALGRVASYRFDPRSLRTPTPLSATLANDGAGLPGFIARMALARDGTMDSLENEFRRRFPFYSAIVTHPSAGDKGDTAHLRFRTRKGGELPCVLVSDGVMLSLAFLAVRHGMRPPDVLLVEEPENGVHHSSLKDIVGTLKQLSQDQGVQVILTTHSPYLLDEVEPEDVRVFEKDDEGAVHCKRLSDFEDVESMKKDFMTGEIWDILAKAHQA